MKHLLSLCLCASVFNLHAAVPLRWTVETSRVQPATFDAYQGETLTFEAALQSYGKPLASPSEYAIYWQTNGMGSAWWVRPCTVPDASRVAGAGTNVLYATFSPDMDVGAKVYSCFIGLSNSIYRAAFQLRLRPSPGALPNELPLPTPVIDFSKVTVLNPPWSGGGSGGVDTNAVLDIIHKTVEGESRYLPPYLHYKEMDDTYPEAAAEWYAQADYSHGSCSARRTGNLLERNYDWNFDFMPEYVIRIPSGTVPAASSPRGVDEHRFASLAVCNVGTNLTEADVVSGKHLRWLKAMPGHAVDGINENGVVAEVNVTGGTWPRTTGAVHGLGAVRWALDHATNAQHAAEYLAANVYLPEGFGANFHWMIADASQTWIVENGAASNVTAVAAKRVMTNFPILPDTYSGMGKERYQLLHGGEPITNAWFTRAYSPSTEWLSEFRDATEMMDVKAAWASLGTREARRNRGLWQTVHCSIYDITNRTLRICVQETPDWYTFTVPAASSPRGVDEGKVREIVEPMIAAHHDETKLDKSYYGSFIRWGDLDNLHIHAHGFKVDSSDKISFDTDGNGFEVDGTDVLESLAAKRDLTDNACHKTEFTEWVCDREIEEGWHVEENPIPGYNSAWTMRDADGTLLANDYRAPSDTTYVEFPGGLVEGVYRWTRTKVAVTGETFVTTSYVTDAVATKQDALPYPTNAIPTSAIDGLVQKIHDEAPAPGDYAAVSNAAMSAISQVTNTDANLIFTITSDGAEPRFYFTPIGAVDPTEED